MDQALPSQYPDLGTLFQTMPAFAAMQAGIQSRQAQENNQSLQDAFNQEQQYLINQKRPADIAASNASTNHLNSVTKGQDLSNIFTEQTQPGKIAAANAASKTAVGKDEIEQMQQTGDLYRNVAAQVAMAPTTWEKVATAKRLLGDHVNQTPEFDQFLAKHANNLHVYFKDMGDSIYNASRDAMANSIREERELAKVREQGENAKEVARINAQSRVDAKNAGSKIAPSEAQLVGKMSFDKQAGYYNARADEEEAAGDKERAQYYRQQADQAKIAFERAKILAAGAAGAGKPDVGALAGIPTQPGPTPQGFSQPPSNIQSLEDIRKQHPEYASKSDADIRKAYKAKFGVDLK